MNASRPRRRRWFARRGLTLMEVMMAMVILTAVLLGMGKFITAFAHTATDGATMSVAADLVQDRLEYIKTTQPYSALSSYAGIEGTIPGHPGYTRETDVQRTNSSSSDYTVVTVTVSHPTLQKPVAKTTVIAAF